MNKKQAALIALSLITIVAILHTLEHYGLISIPLVGLAITRWLAIASIIWFAIKKKSLTTWILVSMVVGAEVGHDWPTVAVNFQVLSKIFLSMIKTVIAPLLFGTLVVGIAGHSDIKQVGRMGWKSLLYFEIVTTIALFIGLAAINISQAGVGIKVPPNALHENLPEPKPQNWQDIVLHVFPENIAKSIYHGDILPIVVFSVIFGISLLLVKEKFRGPMLGFCESLSEVMFKFTNIVMYYAPIGVGAAIAFTVGHGGLAVLGNLLQLLATLYVALLIFMLVVFLPVALIIKLPIGRFIREISEPVSIAFATTSSESALPKAMEAMERMGVPRKVIAFVMPTGYSFNLDGSTLYLALAAVFVSQAAGHPLSWGQQILMVFTLMLTSKGVAGVPRATLVIILGTVHSFNLPTWPVFLILGIDELMDMARTSVNVIGNCLATAVIGRWEGEVDFTKLPPETKA
ncbi:cation:dicarboxylase symporter family transporter [Chitinophaga sp. SYP-B3965]|uniref:dicarboxylate/amino acid:cation symporter n=1 Tax=Chitinophaga sp. SYP-B3965 TaxID=2663120 RepID=UPI0012996700|nr:cation:dicarboxylase symporter family transporter [Chitinophaga sp. SYP-B3965]MRG46195.1 cation:dicarboxylase symporter family transporter [Chitinophaga sp. SYP-B3965]